jgi:23S rRNA (adenine2503-C2)-methyltransferase
MLFMPNLMQKNSESTPAPDKFVNERWSSVTSTPNPSGCSKKYIFTKPDCAVEASVRIGTSATDTIEISCSTMCGCPMGCHFCGAGEYFVRSLTASEIVSQAQIILSNCREFETSLLTIRLISMGEPLLNSSLSTALSELHNMYPNAKLGITTSAPRIDWTLVIQMGVSIPKLDLQFSVHHVTDQERDALIPFKHKLTLEQISMVGHAWHESTGRKPSFNYCVLPSNSTEFHASKIIALFPPDIWRASISVVASREHGGGVTYQSEHALAHDFSSRLAMLGYSIEISDTGDLESIGGACGQLWSVQEWFRANSKRARNSQGNRRRRTLHQQSTGMNSNL